MQSRVFACVGIAVALLAAGCRKNHPPKVVSVTANPIQVQRGGASEVTAVAVDPDKESLSYQWSASGGFLSSSQGSSVTWKAPDSTGVYVVRLSVTDKSKASDSGSVKVAVAPQVHTETIVDGSVLVVAPQFQDYTVLVTPDMDSAVVTGRFTAIGGSGNDIKVLVMDGMAFTNWVNGHEVNVNYASGQVTTGTFAVALHEPGTYHVVFDNRFSFSSNKRVSAKVVFVYLQ